MRIVYTETARRYRLMLPKSKVYHHTSELSIRFCYIPGGAEFRASLKTPDLGRVYFAGETALGVIVGRGKDDLRYIQKGFKRYMYTYTYIYIHIISI